MVMRRKDLEAGWGSEWWFSGNPEAGCWDLLLVLVAQPGIWT